MKVYTYHTLNQNLPPETEIKNDDKNDIITDSATTTNHTFENEKSTKSEN